MECNETSRLGFAILYTYSLITRQFTLIIVKGHSKQYIVKAKFSFKKWGKIVYKFSEFLQSKLVKLKLFM